MTCVWLAAVLEPRSLASHPNFSRATWDTRPEVRLASRLAGEPWRWRDHLHSGAEASRDEDVESALASFDVVTQEQAGRLLLTRAIRPDVMEIGKAVPFGLISFAALAELEDYDAIFDGLGMLLDRVTREAASEQAPIFKALLHQQRALRQKDLRQDFVASVEAAVNELRAFSPSSCEKFETAPAVAMSSVEVLRRVKRNVEVAASAILPLDLGDKPRKSKLPDSFELLRRPGSPLAVASDRQRASLLDTLLEKASLEPTVMADGWPIDNDLYFINLQHEFYGHGWVYGTREHVAQLRLLAGTSELSRDVIVMLRQSQNQKLLEQVLERIRQVGPLGALATDARQVLERRLGVDRLTVQELLVLEAAAELLSPPEASVALDAVIGLLRAGGPSDRAGHWSAQVMRQEVAWRAACQLANACGREYETVAFILRQALASGSDDQLLDRSVARALDGIAWEEPLASASGEAFDELPSVELPLTNEVLRGVTSRIPSSTGAPPENLEQVRHELNDVIQGRLPDFLDVDESVRIVGLALKQVSTDAISGKFSYGGADVAELATGLIIHGGAEELWSSLSEVLGSPLIPHLLKRNALTRLSEATVAVPPDILQNFIVQGEALVQGSPLGPRWIGDEVVPFPAMTRFLGRYRCLEDGRLVSLTAQLSAQSEIVPRREAARNISFFARVRQDLDLSGLALALSVDSDLRIRSRSAVAMNVYAMSSSVYKASLEEALDRLLQEDGLEAPMWMLSALRESDQSLSESVKIRVAHLMKGHPSWVVRKLARSLLAA